MKTIKKIDKLNLSFDKVLTKLGGQKQLNKVIKSIKQEQSQKIKTINEVGFYGVSLINYHQTNLKGTITIKKWYSKHFQPLLNFDYSQLTTYIKLYKYENSIDEFKGRKTKSLSEGNFTSKNQMLKFVRDLQPKTKKPTKIKEGNKVLSWFIGDSEIKRSIIETKGEFKFKFGKDTKTNPNEDILPHIEELISKLEEVKSFYDVQVLKIEHEEVI